MFQRVWKKSLVTVNTSLTQIHVCVSLRLKVNHVPSFGIVHVFCLNIIWNRSHAMNTCMVLADSHELMEDVPHPCIFKDRCSHLERGWGHGRTIFILIVDTWSKGTHGFSGLFRIHRELST